MKRLPRRHPATPRTPVREATRWVRVAPARAGWHTADPEDPDFTLVYTVLPRDTVRVRVALPYRLALRLVGKRLSVTRSRAEPPGQDTVTINLGLTRVYRLAGNRLDRWLEKMVTVEVNRKAGAGGL